MNATNQTSNFQKYRDVSILYKLLFDIEVLGKVGILLELKFFHGIFLFAVSKGLKCIFTEAPTGIRARVFIRPNFQMSLWKVFDISSTIPTLLLVHASHLRVFLRL